MEEILASIRKIISDDQKVLEAKAGMRAPVASEPESPADDEDVLELGTPEPAPVAAAPVIAPPPVVAPAPVVAAPVAPAPVTPAPVAAVASAQPGLLLSEASAATAATAFQSLANTVLSQNARTLDDIVKDMLRPMLKSWLDDNLPTLVERLVRAEIERVARGGR
jgi:cell pole-organizing protein PopZ